MDPFTVRAFAILLLALAANFVRLLIKNRNKLKGLVGYCGAEHNHNADLAVAKAASQLCLGQFARSGQIDDFHALGLPSASLPSNAP